MPENDATRRQFSLLELGLLIAWIGLSLALWRWLGSIVLFPVGVSSGVWFGRWLAAYDNERFESGVRGGELGGAGGLSLAGWSAAGTLFTNPTVGLLLLVLTACLGFVFGGLLALCASAIFFRRED